MTGTSGMERVRSVWVWNIDQEDVSQVRTETQKRSGPHRKRRRGSCQGRIGRLVDVVSSWILGRETGDRGVGIKDELTPKGTVGHGHETGPSPLRPDRGRQ